LAEAEAHLADKVGEPTGPERAEALADRAIALAQDSADGYAVRGELRAAWLWDWDGAQKDIDHALAIDPTDVLALTTGSDVFQVQGRLSKAIAMQKRSIQKPRPAVLQE
jgi:tetratricopeptide (TPR) repeat protein